MTEIKLKKKHIFFLGLWGLLATIALYAYLAFLQPSKFTPFIQGKVNTYIPELSFENVEFTLFPRLGVEFSGIQYKNEFNNYSLDVEARSLLSQMSWLSLFKGDFNLAFAELTQPSISLEHKKNKERETENSDKNNAEITAENKIEQEEKSPLTASKIFDFIPQQLKSSQFKVLDGEFYFIPFQEKEQINTYYLGSINLNLDAFENIDLAIKEFKLVQTTSVDNIAKSHSFSDLMLKLEQIQVLDSEVLANINLQSNLSLYDERVLSQIKSKGQISLNQDFTLKPFKQDIELDSTFHIKNQDIPSKAKLTLEYIDKNTLNISHADINIEENLLTLSSKLKELTTNPKAEINATFKNLNLPRWLSYTREIPAAIVTELSKLEGSFTASLDKNALITKDLKVTTHNKHIVDAKVDYNFADGHKLAVDAYLPKLNFNILLPELENKPTIETAYLHDTLDSLLHASAEEKNAPNYVEPSFIYDIKVSANDITFWKYNFRNLSFAVLPYEKGTQIPINMTHFFDGTLSSQILIHDAINIETEIKETSVKEFFKAITQKSPLSGMLNSKIKLTLQTDTELEKMFSKPNLDVSASLTDGAFNPDENAFAFKKFAAHSKVSHIDFPANISDVYGFLGEHSLNFVKDEHTIKLHIPKANLLYNMKTGLPNSISPSYALVEYISDFPLHILSNGMLEFDFPSQHIVYKDFKGTLYNEKLHGSIDFTSFANPQITGTSSFEIKNLKSFMKKYNISMPSLRDKSALSHANITNSFTYKDNVLTTKDIKVNIDEYAFTGSVEHDFSKTKQTIFALSSDFFNADRYLDFTKHSDATPFSSNTLLPLDTLSKLNTRGSFSFEKLWFFRTPFYKANIPMMFNKGTISITPTALFPTSGSIAMNAAIQVKPQSLDYNIQTKAKDVDMLALSQAQGLSSLLAGNGTFSLETKGIASKSSDIFKNMQGEFSAWIEHGFFINSISNPKVDSYKNPPIPSPYVPKNLKTSFSLISASGPIKNGILKLDNINMTGKPIGFVGQSTIDLNKWTISLAALASYENAAKIPVSLNGSLSDPQLSVKVLGLLTQTFTSLTNSLVNTLTDIIKKPLDLIK